MTRSEVEDFHRSLEHTAQCRYWSWAEPQVYHTFLRVWPPGYLGALSHWERLPWRVRQLLAIAEHEALEPGLRIWRVDLGFELELFLKHVYTEPEFRQLAVAAAPSMAFLLGLLWRADPEVAQASEWSTLQEVLRNRQTMKEEA